MRIWIELISFSKRAICARRCFLSPENLSDLSREFCGLHFHWTNVFFWCGDDIRSWTWFEIWSELLFQVSYSWLQIIWLWSFVLELLVISFDTTIWSFLQYHQASWSAFSSFPLPCADCQTWGVFFDICLLNLLMLECPILLMIWKFIWYSISTFK